MEHSSTSTRVYFIVYFALLILLALTVAVAQVDLGVWSTVVAMTIAVVKALLVLLYFMHLRYSSRLIWLFAGAGFVWLLIMLTYTLTDYLSRTWVGSY
jgi:cytochrome c oxidase subunit 4